MPELPEVETIRSNIADLVGGRQIKQVEVRLPRLIKWPTAEAFAKTITGRTVSHLSRRGKYLLLYLEGATIIVIHLRMTGRLYYRAAGSEPDRFARILFYLDNGATLIYADTRTLGTLYAMPDDELWRIHGLSTMGPEPLTDGFTVPYLQETLSKRKGKIKPLLLNQEIIGGLGNIYVDESLALAGIHPERAAASLSQAEIETLHAAINQVIKEALEHKGTTFRDYRDGFGNQGSHQYHLRVYGRKDEPCDRCGTMISHSKVGGRGTHFCPNCQH